MSFDKSERYLTNFLAIKYRKVISSISAIRLFGNTYRRDKANQLDILHIRNICFPIRYQTDIWRFRNIYLSDRVSNRYLTFQKPYDNLLKQLTQLFPLKAGLGGALVTCQPMSPRIAGLNPAQTGRSSSHPPQICEIKVSLGQSRDMTTVVKAILNIHKIVSRFFNGTQNLCIQQACLAVGDVRLVKLKKLNMIRKPHQLNTFLVKIF